MLRLRLILWYTFLVGLTILTVGVVQNILIERSLVDALDSSLVDDASTTMKLLNQLPKGTDPEEVLQHGRMHTDGSLREMIDHVLKETPDTVSGSALTDRVMSHLVDEILTELSYGDSDSTAVDPLDAVVQRSISGKRNNLIEIHVKERMSNGNVRMPVLFRTENLGADTLSRLSSMPPLMVDTTLVLGRARHNGETIRIARSEDSRFVVYVAFPTTDIRESLGKLRGSFFYLIPLAMLVSMGVGLLLARKALRPIEQIADTAKEISAKNLSQRIKLPGSTDRELATLTETLNSMFARLENSFKQVNQFTSDASHELKTPLAIMKGEIEQAARHLEQAQQLRKEEAFVVLESLMEEVDRMQRIVEGLLLLSKADDRKLPLQKEPVRIYDFLSSLCEDAEILAEERGLQLHGSFAASAKDVVLSIDTTRFYQVMLNLVTNALKYTPEGGTIEMFLRRNADNVQFGVKDTGIGISQEDLSKIFQRFYRADVSRTGPEGEEDRSLGLGLAIVKSIVEAHDGTITVESIPDNGSTFTVTLPME